MIQRVNKLNKIKILIKTLYPTWLSSQLTRTTQRSITSKILKICYNVMNSFRRTKWCPDSSVGRVSDF